MPMHDWKRVSAAIYHHFHQQWTIAICDALNAGLLPPGYSALVEPFSSGLYPDVAMVQRRSAKPSPTNVPSATLQPPHTRMTVRAREGRFHERANQIVVRHHLGEVVCAIEVVSPGNKAGKIAVREFIEKAVEFLRRGTNLLVVDPFPPGTQDPQTLHKRIWDEFDEDVPFSLPPDEPLLLASYRAAVPVLEVTPEAFIEPFRVGAELPDMPAWLDADLFVYVPLERTYQAAWDVCPPDFRDLVEHGGVPGEDAASD